MLAAKSSWSALALRRSTGFVKHPRARIENAISNFPVIFPFLGPSFISFVWQYLQLMHLMKGDVKWDYDYGCPPQGKAHLTSSNTLTCSVSAQWPNGEPSLSLPPIEWAWQFCFDWHESLLRTHAHTQKQSFVLSLRTCRQWRGLILHSRVDRSLVYFIHFTWRDACLSWLAASLRFTQHCTRQTMRQFCSRPASSGEAALDGCYCIHFELKYH